MTVFLRRLNNFRQQPFFQLFTIYLRYLLGGGFVIAAIGMGKLSGEQILISQPGQSIETLEPIGQFFRVMSTSGLYWNFIGWSQIISGALLMTQRFAKIGAVFFLGMIVNIFIITVSYDFHGTPVVTGLMLLATIYLIMWDFDSFQAMVLIPGKNKIVLYEEPPIVAQRMWMITGVVMLATLLLMAMLNANIGIQFGAAFLEGLIAFVVFVVMFAKKKAVQDSFSQQ